ncbi:MAG: ABC transporter ATP-binding protein [Proteobacteria bacterium]|nr:ABC transporter ATP-binding protein [Pseudomonadota bacterium]
MNPLLKVDNLQTHFFTPEGVIRAADGISFELSAGETLGLVGESGSGKTVTALSILRLVPPPGRIVGGRIEFAGRDILQLNPSELRKIRGDRIAMVFQEPMSALNPVLTVGNQVLESVRLHQKVSRREGRDKTVELFKLVGIPSPEMRFAAYPHQLSGGMRQRVMLAMALAGKPDLLLADEPTTALDVTIQAQVLNLLDELKKNLGMAVLFITHDLGIIAEHADRVAICYAGKIVEMAPVRELFSRPAHPYTQGLLNSIPKFSSGEKDLKLTALPGTVPDLKHLPPGCRFEPRCSRSRPECRQYDGELKTMRTGHLAACINPIN